MMVISQLVKATGLHLELGRPFTFEYDSMLVLWSNQTFEEHTAMPALLGNKFEKGKAIIHAAMNEGNMGKDVEPRWWWSWDENEVKLLHCSWHMSNPLETTSVRNK
ncbi:hypothetical protein C8T65DRAFT_746048 [Cerioporus squamosus]|nr:hypothetical protein C8T65DRAFT_746048 [Cerioporus squamosus]